LPDKLATAKTLAFVWINVIDIFQVFNCGAVLLCFVLMQHAK